MGSSQTLHIINPKDWRVWLENNHLTAKEIWLIFFKKHTGKPRLAYEDAVEEALCFGWIDSIIKRIDDEKYMQKYTPRKKNSNWSISNIKRIKKLIKNGKMTGAGLSKIDQDLLNRPIEIEENNKKKELVIPPFIQKALDEKKKAQKNFIHLSDSEKKKYIGWVGSAKKEETRIRRLIEMLQLLEQNKKLGMK